MQAQTDSHAYGGNGGHGRAASEWPLKLWGRRMQVSPWVRPAEAARGTTSLARVHTSSMRPQPQQRARHRSRGLERPSRPGGAARGCCRRAEWGPTRVLRDRSHRGAIGATCGGRLRCVAGPWRAGTGWPCEHTSWGDNYQCVQGPYLISEKNSAVRKNDRFYASGVRVRRPLSLSYSGRAPSGIERATFPTDPRLDERVTPAQAAAASMPRF
jgi:hypothetical protein